MKYRLDDITESFMNKIRKVRDEKKNDPLSGIRSDLSASINRIRYACPEFGIYLENKCNAGNPISYSMAKTMRINFNRTFFFDFEKDYHQPYTFNEMRFFENSYSEGNIKEIQTLRYSQCLMEVSIPPTWTEIPDCMFERFFNLRKVNFSGNIKRIGNSAFAVCSKLSEMNIPDSVIELGKDCFSNDNSLTSIVIPSSITEIPEGMCNECKNLTSVVLPPTINKLGDSTFARTKLRSIRIPKKVKLIPSSFMSICENLTEIDFPPAVREIKSDAFANCYSLRKVTIRSKIKFDAEFDEKACTFFDEGLYVNNAKAIKSNVYFELWIPEKLKEYYSQEGKIPFMDLVTEIHYFPTPERRKKQAIKVSESFMGKIKKKQEDITGKTTTQKLAGNVYDSINEIVFACLPLGRFISKKYNDGRPITYADAARIPLELGGNLFKNFEDDYGIKEKYTFHELKFFSHAFCPQKIERPSGFLSELTLPDHWTEIPVEMFYENHGLFDLTIINFSDNVTKFGNLCFSDCNNWKNVHLSRHATILGESMFSNDIIPDSFEIPNTVTEIPANCFFKSKGLKELVLPDSIKFIRHDAFHGMEFEKVYMPDSVFDIGQNAFSDCEHLKSIRLSSSLSEIPKGCFRNCTSLESIKIPDGVLYMEDNCIINCRSLKELDIPASVQEIGLNFMIGNVSIKKITIHSKIKFNFKKKDSKSFGGYDLYIPLELKNYYSRRVIALRAGSVHYF